MLFFAIHAQAGQVLLVWDPSTSPNVGGYQLVYGQTSGNYTVDVDVGKQTSYTLTGLVNGALYYFAVKAYDTTRTVESGFSNEVSQTISVSSGGGSGDGGSGGTGGNTGLVAAYGFEEASGTTVVDASGQGNNGVNIGATRTSSGKYGTALTFGGTKYVTVPNSGSLNIGGTGLTSSFFANITNTGRDQVLIDKPWNSASYPYPYYQYGVEFRARSGVFVFYLGDTVGSSHMYSMSAPLDTWTNIAFTYDGANVRGYVDGVLQFTTPGTFSIQARGNPLRIGLDHTGGQPTNGSLDEIRIYNRALSVSEIQTDMNTAP